MRFCAWFVVTLERLMRFVSIRFDAESKMPSCHASPGYEGFTVVFLLRNMLLPIAPMLSFTSVSVSLLVPLGDFNLDLRWSKGLRRYTMTYDDKYFKISQVQKDTIWISSNSSVLWWVSLCEVMGSLLTMSVALVAYHQPWRSSLISQVDIIGQCVLLLILSPWMSFAFMLDTVGDAWRQWMHDLY